MKKIISFDKNVEFPTTIGKISSISLDHTLKFSNKNNISGNFFISGTYKMTEASRIDEEFNYSIPIEIEVSENYDLDTAKITIDDFYYEIENDQTLKCKIDVLIEGVEEVILDSEIEKLEEEKPLEALEKTEERECDGEVKEESEKEIPVKEVKTTDNNIKINSLFSNLPESEETYKAYSVYILRENDTIETVINKYKTTREELAKYNDLNNLKLLDKIIIPCTDA